MGPSFWELPRSGVCSLAGMLPAVEPPAESQLSFLVTSAITGEQCVDVSAWPGMPQAKLSVVSTP